MLNFQGGDGFFNEILNGFLLRHKAPFPPAPSDFIKAIETDGNSPVHGPDETGAENHQKEEDPLLVSSRQIGMGFSNSSVYHNNYLVMHVKNLQLI